MVQQCKIVATFGFDTESVGSCPAQQRLVGTIACCLECIYTHLLSGLNPVLHCKAASNRSARHPGCLCSGHNGGHDDKPSLTARCCSHPVGNSRKLLVLNAAQRSASNGHWLSRCRRRPPLCRWTPVSSSVLQRRLRQTSCRRRQCDTRLRRLEFRSVPVRACAKFISP